MKVLEKRGCDAQRVQKGLFSWLQLLLPVDHVNRRVARLVFEKVLCLVVGLDVGANKDEFAVGFLDDSVEVKYDALPGEECRHPAQRSP